MPAKSKLLLLIGASAVMTMASPVTAQAFPGQAKVFTGTGVFTDQQVYMGPIVGYINNAVSSPFSFSLSYYNFMGSDTILPGTVRISSPTLFRNDALFTGNLAIAMPNATNYSITLTDPSTIQYLALSLDVGTPFPTAPGPVAVQPTSTINYSGRFFGYSGSITSFSTAPDVAAVPETATWAMMILGVGAIGALLRRKQRVHTRIAFA